MKILGLICGRKMSNLEIFVKEVLMGVEELGVEVELVRLNDLNIKFCIGCNVCVVSLFGKLSFGECIIKDDDFVFIEEKIMECDGLIFGLLIYEKGFIGLLKILVDRMGLFYDVVFRFIFKKNCEEKRIIIGILVDERFFKIRVVLFIVVGGSEWDNLVFLLMYLLFILIYMDVVDKILVNWIGFLGSVVFNDDVLVKVRKLGCYVVKCLLE